MTQSARIPFFQLAPDNLHAMIALAGSLHKSSLEARLIELVDLRVSQLNGCGVCVDMHWRALMKMEAEPRHLNALSGWREAPFFSARERAALNWAEAVNAIPQRHPGDADFALLKQHMTDGEIAELSYVIATIKAWNVINISLQNPVPEVPAPGF